MNFFDHQQQARLASRRLVVLFALAVIATVLAVNLVVALVLSWFGAFAPGVQVVTAGGAVIGGAQAALALHGAVTVLALLLIGAGSWWEMSKLRAGGDAVAQMVGARLVDPGTPDLLERRLMNVVEEMALASGTPVPRVYVMDGEPGINAFAAGHTVNDAVVAVTRGALTRLERDELQGVIAHEFSHILNGDMALNLRLIGVLFGLTMIALAGRFLVEAGRGGRDNKGVAAAALIGVALWIIGYVGVFCGRLIKAGVSRQREFLADASAVQFTRNPDGIGGALRRIGAVAGARDLGAPLALGTEIRHPHAETLSHLFLGAARANFARGLLATHPPLAERIQRIYGRAMDWLPATEQPLALAMAGEPAAASSGRAGATLGDGLTYDAALRSAAALPEGAALQADRTRASFEELLAPAGPAGARPPPAGKGAAQRAWFDATSPLTALAAGAGAAPVTARIGRAQAAPGYAAAWARQLNALGLDPVLADSVRAPLLALALLVEKSSDVAQQQMEAIAQTFGAPAAGAVQALHATVQRLPPGARLPLLDRAMPALRKLSPAEGDRLLLLAHTLILADGRMSLPEFLLFTVLRRRLGTDARRPPPLRYGALRELADDASIVLSLLAHLRDPDAPVRAFARAQPLLPQVPLALAPAASLALDRIGDALDRLNQLVPLARPALIEACAAVALDDGGNWQAASALRSVCAALDAPLPPALEAAGR